jgi:hypothetical protein
MGPFGIEFLQKFTVFCFPRTEISEQNAREVFNLLESLAIEVPDTGHWWTTAPGQELPATLQCANVGNEQLSYVSDRPTDADDLTLAAWKMPPGGMQTGDRQQVTPTTAKLTVMNRTSKTSRRAGGADGDNHADRR